MNIVNRKYRCMKISIKYSKLRIVILSHFSIKFVAYKMLKGKFESVDESAMYISLTGNLTFCRCPQEATRKLRPSNTVSQIYQHFSV